MATDLQLLIRDKYDGDASKVTEEDRKRLASDEPLAYIIGWVPFMELKVHLDTHPLTPRPETEWWTELLIERLRERFNGQPFSLLDLCAGSGCIGLAVLHAFPAAQVSFAELVPEHCDLIRKNIEANSLDASRASIYKSDVFSGIPADTMYDCIATNPPYIPEERVLEESVTSFEPKEALFAGQDGLGVIEKIAKEAGQRLNSGGELWMECDTGNIDKAEALLVRGGAARTQIRTDLYGRARLLVAYF